MSETVCHVTEGLDQDGARRCRHQNMLLFLFSFFLIILFALFYFHLFIFFFLKFLNAFKTQLEESSECALRDRDSNANLMMADCAFIASSSTSTLVCRRFYGY